MNYTGIGGSLGGGIGKYLSQDSDDKYKGLYGPVGKYLGGMAGSLLSQKPFNLGSGLASLGGGIGRVLGGDSAAGRAIGGVGGTLAGHTAKNLFSGAPLTSGLTGLGPGLLGSLAGAFIKDEGLSNLASMGVTTATNLLGMTNPITMLPSFIISAILGDLLEKPMYSGTQLADWSRLQKGGIDAAHAEQAKYPDETPYQWAERARAEGKTVWTPYAEYNVPGYSGAADAGWLPTHPLLYNAAPRDLPADAWFGEKYVQDTGQTAADANAGGMAYDPRTIGLGTREYTPEEWNQVFSGPRDTNLLAGLRVFDRPGDAYALASYAGGGGAPTGIGPSTGITRLTDYLPPELMERWGGKEALDAAGYDGVRGTGATTNIPSSSIKAMLNMIAAGGGNTELTGFRRGFTPLTTMDDYFKILTNANREEDIRQRYGPA